MLSQDQSFKLITNCILCTSGTEQPVSLVKVCGAQAAHLRGFSLNETAILALQHQHQHIQIGLLSRPKRWGAAGAIRQVQTSL